MSQTLLDEFFPNSLHGGAGCHSTWGNAALDQANWYCSVAAAIAIEGHLLT